MKRRLKRGLAGWVLMLALVQASTTRATDFAVRQVTNLGNPSTGLSASTLLGAVNDRLLFQATANGVKGLYRTDGTITELVSSPVNIDTDEVALLNNELFFAATGSSGKELYSTDGLTLRQVADVAPNALSSLPSDFIVLNNRLLFSGISTDLALPGGAPVRFFHTDGITVQEFPSSLFPPSGSARLGNQLVYGGIVPGSGGPLTINVTDGDSFATIATPPVDSLVSIARAGNYAYFIAGQGAQRGIHRTNGTIDELVSTLGNFTSLTNVESLFEIDHKLAFMMQDVVAKELVFFRSDGSTPTETLRWPIPSGVSISASFTDSEPIFSDGTRAYFTLRSGANQQLYMFDGSSFSLLATGNPFTQFDFTELNNRVFLNIDSPLSTLYEIVNGALVPLGANLNRMVAFQGEILGANSNILGSFGPTPLWQLRDGALASLGNVVALDPFSTDRLVVSGNQLYFSGQSGNNRQISALAPVPEPTTLSLVSAAATAVLIARTRRHARKRYENASS